MDTFRPVARLVALLNAVPAAAEPDAVAIGQLVTVLRDHGEDLESLASADALELIQALDRLRDVLAIDDVDGAAVAINEIFDEVAARPRLSRHGGTAWHIHVDPDDADSGWGTWLLASSALALAGIIQEHARRTWGRCEAAGCQRYFVGDGRGGARRYCSTTCSSRARVAQHRSRLRTSDVSGRTSR
ncbi:CGNR zinc finger domain-containing protein [Phytoactinopolyspora limicola]|uniref:CGNR zinc finger domain-containing protein n=1 Tax=Phytoactinopolyspora limicola TaxID=2715536 RepID=UPI001A9C4CC4|nr:CGNR zinc finger domain-containing protein [Phytoactinopolyspora limicola]